MNVNSITVHYFGDICIMYTTRTKLFFSLCRVTWLLDRVNDGTKRSLVNNLCKRRTSKSPTKDASVALRRVQSDRNELNCNIVQFSSFLLLRTRLNTHNYFDPIPATASHNRLHALIDRLIINLKRAVATMATRRTSWRHAASNASVTLKRLLHGKSVR